MAGGYSSGKIAIAICGRCSEKMPYNKLMADGNNPKLRVCKECRDPLDPYKLPPRQADSYLLKDPRPDRKLDDIPQYILGDDGFPLLDENGKPILR